MAKDRIVPRYELPGHDQWWDENATLPAHGASGVGTRAVRHAKKKPKPTWTIVVMFLGLILVILVGLLLFQDYRRAVAEGDHTVVTSAASERPSGQVLHQPLSPDTIKRKLQAKGFEVDYLVSVADQRNLAYDAAEAHIDGTPALILAFKDYDTTLKWIRATNDPVIYHNTWAVSVSDQNLAGHMAQKMGADLRG